jgi:hypothetical protein
MEKLMDRVYLNRRRGERRIHVEIDEAEIGDLLDRPDSESAHKLAEILGEARRDFGGGRA